VPSPADALQLDHLAFPDFDPAATHRFYTGVLGLPLVFALEGESDSWKKRYLLTAYAIGDGRFLDFFSFEGIAREAPSHLPKDIRHVALCAGSGQAVSAWRARLVEHRIEHWTEEHGEGDVHLYFCDPNGVLLEINAQPDAPFMTMDRRKAEAIVEQWCGRTQAGGSSSSRT
jgi:catechol 2,3-dioxygenase-like lactoylglutathione lyase family enzyme